MLLDTSIVECKLLDLPTIDKFPSTTEQEWKNYRHFGLRSAHSYILVYDVSSVASFYYIQRIRDQIVASRGLADIPIIVAANKRDLATSKIDNNELVREQSRSKHEIVSTVHKTWRASHIECSAKHNWNITAVFKELAKEIICRRDNAAIEEDQQKCCAIWN